MECPKCGNEIPEGKLYCPSCGYAVQIVPDYDADLEENLSSVGSDIAGTVNRIDVAESAVTSFDEDSTTKEIPMVRKDDVSNILKRGAKNDEARQKLMVYAGAGVFAIILIVVTMVASKSLDQMSFVPVAALDEVISEGETMNMPKAAIEIPTEEMPSKEWVDENEPTEALSEDEAYEDEVSEELIITPEGGSYSKPEGISAKIVLISEDEESEPEDVEGTIYFTRDGSDPDENSEIFSREIAMPVGRSSFAFRYMDSEGNMSDTYRAEYDLEYEGAACSTTDAANLIIATLVKDGALLDIYGHVAGSLGMYTYQCNSMITSDDRDYFLIPESYEEPGGQRKRTGKIYAVDAENLSMFTVSQGSNGKYSFEVFF